MKYLAKTLVILWLSLQRCCYGDKMVNVEDITTTSSLSQWCNYIHTTPEPNLLIFNRFMKCGSSTMNSIISRLQRKHLSFYFHSQDGVEWRRSNSNEIYKSLEHISNTSNTLDHSNTSKMMIIEGHFNWKDFGDLKTNIEYIQLLRNCPDRHTSNFFYRLPNNGKDLKPRLVSCLLNEECVKTMPDIAYMGTQDYSETFCGWRCETKNVLEHLHPPQRGQFTVVGLLEYFQEYLEMLECVYPTIFREVFSLPNLFKIRENVSGGSNKTQSHVVQKVMREKCHGSSDEEVYLAMKEIFLKRYEFMKLHRNECCR